MHLIMFIVLQHSSQPNFIAFPSQTLSASFQPQPVSFKKKKYLGKIYIKNKCTKLQSLMNLLLLTHPHKQKPGKETEH